MPALTRHVALQPAYHAAPALLLLILSPVFAEMLSGSTPPRDFLNPAVLVLQVLAYGVPAVLLREWAVRQRAGWLGRVLLALPMGFIIEGIICKSYFSPLWPDFSLPLGYGRLFGVNWPWALQLEAYHAVGSFLVPWAVTDILLPRYRETPSLGKRSMLWLGALFLITGVFCSAFIPMDKAGHVYHPGVLACLLSWGSVPLCMWLAARLKDPGPGRWNAPRGIAAFILGFGGWLLCFVVPGLVNPKEHPAGMLIGAELLFLSLNIILAWQWRLRWNPMQQFALLYGSMSFWVLVSIMIELRLIPIPHDPRGMVLFSSFALAGLYLLGRLRLRQQCGLIHAGSSA